MKVLSSLILKSEFGVSECFVDELSVRPTEVLFSRGRRQCEECSENSRILSVFGPIVHIFKSRWFILKLLKRLLEQAPGTGSWNRLLYPGFGFGFSFSRICCCSAGSVLEFFSSLVGSSASAGLVSWQKCLTCLFFFWLLLSVVLTLLTHSQSVDLICRFCPVLSASSRTEGTCWYCRSSQSFHLSLSGVSTLLHLHGSLRLLGAQLRRRIWDWKSKPEAAPLQSELSCGFTLVQQTDMKSIFRTWTDPHWLRADTWWFTGRVWIQLMKNEPFFSLFGE